MNFLAHFPADAEVDPLPELAVRRRLLEYQQALAQLQAGFDCAALVEANLILDRADRQGALVAQLLGQRLRVTFRLV